MKKKEMIWSFLLIIVILVALFFIGRSLGFFGGGKYELPDEVLDTPEERIDSVTFDVITLPLREWYKLGEENGAYRNPETKTYTMMLPMNCGVCGEKIPRFQFPERLRREPVDADDLLRIEVEKNQLMGQYMCPKCGKPAYSGVGVPVLSLTGGRPVE